MSPWLNDWLSRKLGRGMLSIREPRLSRHLFKQALGARGQFAVVHLRGSPAAEFSFTSAAAWPAPEFAEHYTQAVLDGILDEIYAVDLGPVPSRIAFTLERIEWHDIDSCRHAFYRAARGAVRDILGRDVASSNVDYGAV